jgi:hypothetical protein
MNGDMDVQGHLIQPTRAGQARQLARRLMTDQKNRAADGVHRLACRVRSNAITQGDAGGQIAHYRNDAAARLDSMATYMRGADVPTLLRDAGQFARRRPEVLVVGAFLTGLLVARFLREPRRGVNDPWRTAAGRWHEALQKGAQVVSSAAETLKERAESRGLSPETLVEKVAGSRLGKHLAIVGDRIIEGSMKATRSGQAAIR